MNPAVEYLESDDYLYERRSARFEPVLHESPFSNATIHTSAGVTAIRPMFELIEDHEAMNIEGRCAVCDGISTGGTMRDRGR